LYALRRVLISRKQLEDRIEPLSHRKSEKLKVAGFEASMKMVVIWVSDPCSLVEIYPRSEVLAASNVSAISKTKKSLKPTKWARTCLRFGVRTAVKRIVFLVVTPPVLIGDCRRLGGNYRLLL
jgi:hypothetical protein